MFDINTFKENTISSICMYAHTLYTRTHTYTHAHTHTHMPVFMYAHTIATTHMLNAPTMVLQTSTLVSSF